MKMRSPSKWGEEDAHAAVRRELSANASRANGQQESPDRALRSLDRDGVRSEQVSCRILVAGHRLRHRAREVHCAVQKKSGQRREEKGEEKQRAHEKPARA